MNASPLEEEIRAFVRTRLAAYEYTRHVQFIVQMPLTTTGKIRRTDLREWHRRTLEAPPREESLS